MGADELIEERPEVNHGLAEILGARLTSPMTNDDVAARAVVVHDRGVLDGEVVESVCGIFDGVTTRTHDLFDEPICLIDGSTRVIDESRLNRAPGLRERSASSRLNDLSENDCTRRSSLEQFTLGFRRRLGRLQKAVVFRTETRSQRRRFPSPHEQPHRDRHQGRDDDDRESHLHLIIHGLSPRPLRFTSPTEQESAEPPWFLR